MERVHPLAAGPDGTIYGTLPDGRLLWYRRYGHDYGYRIWHGSLQIGVGWQQYRLLGVAGNGFVYAVHANQELWMWRHHGFKTGGTNWTSEAKVGDGWAGPDVQHVLLS